MKTKNVLITGVAGLLGSNLANWIIKNRGGVNVIGIDDLSGGYLENVNRKVFFYQKNIIDGHIENIFYEHKIDVIFHFAAYAAEGLSPFMRVYNYNNNLISTVRLINFAIKHDVSRFVFTSSMATYGPGKTPFNESDIPKPIDSYGIAKLACELDLQVANSQHGLDYCIIRPHNVYGPMQNIWDKYRNVLGIWMNQHLNGNPLTIYGDGTQRRAFSFIEDCVEPLWNAGIKKESSRQTINLGGTKSITIEDAADVLISIMGGGDKKHLEARHEVKNAWSTWEKSQRILDYSEKHNLHEGLSIMWDWAKNQPQRNIKKWDNYELTKGIYNFWK